MKDREKQLALKATRMINDYTIGSFNKVDYNSQIKPSYDVLRDLFYRSDQSEWSLMKCSSFIREHDILPHHFISFLEELFKARFPNHYFQNGRKNAFDFIERLKISPRFKEKVESKPKIKALNQEEYIDFINDLRCFKQKYVQGISQNNWIKLISSTFEMQNAPSTFRTQYFELQSKE